MARNKLDIEFHNQLYNPQSRQPEVLYTTSTSGRRTMDRYRSRIFVTGSDINKIKEVRYTLHPTFPNHIRISKDQRNNFEISIWAWGEFDIEVVVITHNYEEYNDTHMFQFGSQLQDAERQGISFRKVD